MQDIFSLVQPKSALSLAPNTTETMKSENSDGSFAQSFFSIILGQLTQENEVEILSEPLQTLPTTPLSEGLLDLAPTDDKAKSIDEHLLDDLLSVVNALQQNAQTTVFPSLKPSSTLEKILTSETVRQDFANVKSVNDLVDLSKKYNLGLEKLSISQENIDNLKTSFPSLAQNNFFDDLQTALDATKSSLSSDESQPTATNVISFLDKQLQKTEPTPIPSMLSELISKEIKTEPKTTPIVDNVPVDTPIIEESLLVNEKQQISQIETKQTETTQKQVLQTLLQDETVEKTTVPLETVVQKVVNSNETKKVEIPVETEVPISEEESIKVTRMSEVKVEQNTKAEKDIPDMLIKTTKTEKTVEETGLIQKTIITEETKTSNTSSDLEETQTTTDVRSDLKTTNKQDITVKNTPVKESLNQFASDLKEKIEAYRPPIMKVELSLSPKNLGDVDITLLTRGSNLHVNISSSSNTMSLFTQNQAEVKTALINMGFTNLEMNFSDQRNSDQSQQHNPKQNSGTIGNFEEFNEEETALLEIVIPQYV
ncbi:MAG: flagellar hook-length control protein FliK [Sulfurospirillaceae bacterium]|nr:flagellar hook-length control protein FliK [Sulfurospirillaceae bacterium]